jgi:hypothetical protein
VLLLLWPLEEMLLLAELLLRLCNKRLQQLREALLLLL